MIANKIIPGICAKHESLPIELPQIGLTVLHLYHIILKKTHPEILLIDLHSKAISDVLDGEILPDGLEL